jgi:hypothetical protein
MDSERFGWDGERDGVEEPECGEVRLDVCDIDLGMADEETGRSLVGVTAGRRGLGT